MPSAAAINAKIVRRVLTQRATIYSRTANTGPYNLVVKSGLACLLTEVEGGRRPGATSAQRRELANLGTLRFDATYGEMPPNVQVEVDAFPGVRWNIIAATQWPDYVPEMGVVGRTVEVVRAN